MTFLSRSLFIPLFFIRINLITIITFFVTGLIIRNVYPFENPNLSGFFFFFCDFFISLNNFKKRYTLFNSNKIQFPLETILASRTHLLVNNDLCLQISLQENKLYTIRIQFVYMCTNMCACCYKRMCTNRDKLFTIMVGLYTLLFASKASFMIFYLSMA